ncbi:MAG: hypothetical protein ACKO7P_16305 [Bacteroidota bacterium]
MRLIRFTLIPIFFILLSLSGCTKNGKKFKVYFYSDIQNLNYPLSFVLDGQRFDNLPNLHTTLSPTNDTLLNGAMYFTLKTGTHDLVAFDTLGNIKYSGTLKINSDSYYVSTTIGSQTTIMSGQNIFTVFRD